MTKKSFLDDWVYQVDLKNVPSSNSFPETQQSDFSHTQTELK